MARKGRQVSARRRARQMASLRTALPPVPRARVLAKQAKPPRPLPAPARRTPGPPQGLCQGQGRPRADLRLFRVLSFARPRAAASRLLMEIRVPASPRAEPPAQGDLSVLISRSVSRSRLHTHRVPGRRAPRWLGCVVTGMHGVAVRGRGPRSLRVAFPPLPQPLGGAEVPAPGGG